MTLRQLLLETAPEGDPFSSSTYISLPYTVVFCPLEALGPFKSAMRKLISCGVAPVFLQLQGSQAGAWDRVPSISEQPLVFWWVPPVQVAAREAGRAHPGHRRAAGGGAEAALEARQARRGGSRRSGAGRPAT